MRITLIAVDPLLMNAFNTVNLSAACIITSVANAKALGIPESKWVYPLGGAGTHDSDNCKLPFSSWSCPILTVVMVPAYS
jgi:hypothetical protein